ncbi:hypothetical protein M3J09_000456 [Ascochyta lentis]
MPKSARRNRSRYCKQVLLSPSTRNSDFENDVTSEEHISHKHSFYTGSSTKRTLDLETTRPIVLVCDDYVPPRHCRLMVKFQMCCASAKPTAPNVHSCERSHSAHYSWKELWS